MLQIRIILVLFAFLFQIFPGMGQTLVAKNINYVGNKAIENTLHVYHQEQAKNQDVVVFIHGGSWSSGKKETYWWLGRNFAKKEVVSVIINYPLAPNATYKEMALACAQSLKWVKDSIGHYGGNPARIFVMGHSAGGHLAELINADPQYFNAVGIANPIRGIILNDAFGLDMKEYLTKAEKDHYYNDFIRTFSADSSTWHLGSPLFYMENIKHPHLILYGTSTYDAIQIQSERIYKNLVAANVPVELIKIEGKKHVPMISQMIWGRNQLYERIISFVKATE
jgi:acetyl esterase/lipase